MKTVIFVGDRPSRYNLDPKIAFVGTKSHQNLTYWLDKIQNGLLFKMKYSLTNSNSKECIRNLKKLKKAKTNIFVALGNNAADRLDDLKIDYFKLPHPSPKNRMVNNKPHLDSLLDQCATYISENIRKTIIKENKGFFDE